MVDICNWNIVFNLYWLILMVLVTIIYFNYKKHFAIWFVVSNYKLWLKTSWKHNYKYGVVFLVCTFSTNSLSLAPLNFASFTRELTFTCTLKMSFTICNNQKKCHDFFHFFFLHFSKKCNSFFLNVLPYIANVIFNHLFMPS
jgi:hypothetical protein